MARHFRDDDDLKPFDLLRGEEDENETPFTFTTADPEEALPFELSDPGETNVELPIETITLDEEESDFPFDLEVLDPEPEDLSKDP